MIYFAQAEDGGPIKIGHSRDVQARAGSLSSMYGKRMKVLAVLPGGKEDEAAIHARFKHLRFGRSEQFKPGADLLEFIGLPADLADMGTPRMPQPGLDGMTTPTQMRLGDTHLARLDRLRECYVDKTRTSMVRDLIDAEYTRVFGGGAPKRSPAPPPPPRTPTRRRKP